MRTFLWAVVAAGLTTGLASGCNKGSPKIIDAAPPTDAGLVDAVLDDDAAVDAGGDAGATAVGHPGTATVTGAVKASSPNFTLYGTLRSGDGSSASPSYQRRGGVTGATQP